MTDRTRHLIGLPPVPHDLTEEERAAALARIASATRPRRGRRPVRLLRPFRSTL